MATRIKKEADRPDLTPMIDVVFQLLVYFLVSTNFARGEQVYRVDLPSRL